MSEITGWINIILLLVILWHQWSRNKILTDRIDHQSNLLKDTKSAIEQQATAMESQAKVVESAMRYSEVFNPEKFEEVLRKKLEVESAEQITDLNRQHKEELSGQEDKYKKLITQLIKISVDAITAHTNYLYRIILLLMIRVPSKERIAIINEQPDSLIKIKLNEISNQIDETYKKAMVDALAGNT